MMVPVARLKPAYLFGEASLINRDPCASSKTLDPPLHVARLELARLTLLSVRGIYYR